MSKKVSEKQRKDILNLFINGKTLKEISEIFNYSVPTITRQLKINLSEEKFLSLKKSNLIKSKKSENNSKNPVNQDFEISKNNNKKGFDNVSDSFEVSKISYEEKSSGSISQVNTFMEIPPLNYELDNSVQKDLSSVPIESINFPKIVYMIVDKKIELEIKLLNDFPEWQFLSKEELNRKVIEIYYDLKSAKRKCNKDQKVIKVPNTNVFKIVSPLLLLKGISRIVSEENLISLTN